MGFAIYLTACAASDAGAFLAAAGLADTGQPDSECETPISGGVVGDHYLIWRNLRQTRGWPMPDFAAISRTVPVTTCEIVEGAMGCETCRHEGGRLLWRAFGDGDSGYVTEGPVPMPRAELERLSRNQSEALDVEHEADDAFSLAVELFVALTGFRYDEGRETAFTQLDAGAPARKKWWAW